MGSAAELELRRVSAFGSAALPIELVELRRVAWGCVLGVSKRAGGPRQSGKLRTGSVGVDTRRK